MGTRGPRSDQGPETVPARSGSGRRALDASDRLPVGSLVGEYQVVREVAHGGMSTVYRAVHPLIGKEAALKVMAAMLSADEVAVARFLQEARIVARIRHPNIVDVFSFGTLSDGRCYLVMEWIEGEVLADRLRKRRLRPDEIAQTLGQICDALEICHEQGVVHRDLKPANVFLVPMRNRPDFVKLVDFGIAKLIARGTVEHTSPNMVLGTPAYASPEQAGGMPIGPQTDVYALGVVAYEMVLGRRPFDGETAAELYRMHLNEPPPAPRWLWSAIPEQLNQLLLRMLAKDPAERPAISELRAQLVPLCAALPPSPPLAAEVLGVWSAGGTKLLPTPHGRSSPTRTPSSRPRPRVGYTPEPRVPPTNPPLAVRGLGRRWPFWAAGALVPALILIVVAAVDGNKKKSPASPASPAAPTTPAPALSLSAAEPREKPAPPPRSERAREREQPESPGPGASADCEIVVAVNVKTAQIWFDRRNVGSSAERARIQVPDTRVHDLVVTAPGFLPAKRRIACEPGETVPVRIKMERSRPGRSNRPTRDYLLEPF